MHKNDEGPSKENPHLLIILALLATGVNFVYWPPLQKLLSSNANLKDGVSLFVVSFGLNPVLTIVIKIIRYSTKI